MNPGGRNTFSKNERLSSEAAVTRLVTKGKYGFCGCLKYCFLTGNGLDINRVLVSVPKRFFKRAVMRNLLKRRIREAYRTQKQILQVEGLDIMLQFNKNVPAEFGEVKSSVAGVLEALNRFCSKNAVR